MRLVEIASFDNYISAHIAMGRLEEQSIRCYLENEHTVTIDPFLSNAIGGIKLMVVEAQMERAIQILTNSDSQTEDIPVFPS
jgi:hypothetical protein